MKGGDGHAGRGGGGDGTGRARAARLLVPPRQQADGPLIVRVVGLPAGAQVVLRLASPTGPGSWVTSEATFTAVDGTVDVGRDAPTIGYDGVDADGLLRQLPPERRRVTVDETDPLASELLTVTVHEPDADVATSMIERHVIADPVTIHAVTVWAGLRGWFFHPGAGTPRVAVLGVPTVTAVPVERAAALLASHGYPVLLLPRTRPARCLPARDVAEIEAARRWLCGAVGADRARVALVDLDGVPDRASRASTEAWQGLLERLRQRTVAPAQGGGGRPR